MESKLEGDIDELMYDSDTHVKKIQKEMTFSISNLKSFWSLKQTITLLKIEGKIQRTVKKRVKKAALLSVKQTKNLRDSQKKKKKEREKRKEREQRRLKRLKFPWTAEVTLPFPDSYTPFNAFSVVTNLDPQLKLLVDQSNLYA